MVVAVGRRDGGGWCRLLGTVVVPAAGHRRRRARSRDAVGRRLWAEWAVFFATSKPTSFQWGFGVSGLDGSRLAWELLVWTNNGGLALASFLRRVAALFVNGLLYLDVDEFRASSR
jgi:hypothetical protein